MEHLRLMRGLTQHQLAARCTALGRPMADTALSRTERARRRCDIDDLGALATALGAPPAALLLPWPTHALVSHAPAQTLTPFQEALLG
ncbi:helix-turn-helix transcriptional regulator [Streptomyces sp. NPDC048279]|uniref:helix-turn-helix domain-containing protein n=1 Tax=Streptomyces sp. NPDC048279 TaxID=3154714 RepID=UPI00341A5EF5